MHSILIVEDEMLLRRELVANLKNLGYGIAGTASSADEALRILENTPADLILMDVRLEGDSDGIEAAERIRNQFDIPVVYLTGFSEKDLLERAKRTEPYGYLSKPVSPIELSNTIGIVLHKHEADRRVKESERKFRTVFEEAADSLVMVDPDTHAIVDFNERAHTNLGYTREEFAKLRIDDLEVLESSAEISAHIERVRMRDGDVFETKLKDKNGAIHDFVMKIRPALIGDRELHLGVWSDVTERNRMLDELNRKHALLEKAEQLARFGAWEWDFETDRFHLSKEWLRIHGTDNANPTLQELMPIAHPEDRDDIAAALKAAIEEGVPYEAVHRIVRPSDGEERIIQAHGDIVKDADGNPVGMYGTAQDITEFRAAQESLYETIEFTRYLVKHDPNAIAVYDRNLRYLAVSDRYLRDYNVKEEDILGKHHYEVFPEMPQRWKNVHSRCLLGAIESEEDDSFERPDGSITYNRWECRPWYRSNGEIGGIVTYTEVTTERKLSEKALKESEERFKLAMEATNDGIWDWNMVTDEVYRNPSFFSMLGYEESEFPPGYRGWESCLHPDDVEPTMKVLDDYLAGRRDSYEAEFRMYDKSGDEVWILSRAKVVDRDDNGKPSRMVGTHQNITEQKRANRQLAQSLGEKEALLREIHHRVKNNLAVVHALLGLQQEHSTDENHRMMFEESQRRIRSMALAHELLYQTDGFSEIDAEDYFTRLVNYMEGSVSEIGSRLNFITHIDDVAFDLDTSIPLGLILTELISNAAKHAFPGNRSGEVAITLREIDPGEFELVVADNGVGMPDDARIREGNSLGLDLVDTFVQQLRGDLQVRSDEGTEIRIRFKSIRLNNTEF